MNAGSHTNRLFNESGCLSQEALMRYVASMLTEDELKLVEAHISSCPLCKDAAEGISLYNEELAVMDEVAERINKKLRQRFDYFPGRRTAAARGPKFRNLLIPAAASIIILVGIISYFHFFYPESNELALLDEKEVMAPEQEKAETIGGVFEEETAEKGAPVTSQVVEKDEPIPEEVTVSIQEEKIVEQEEIAMVEEEIKLSELDEDIAAVVEEKEMADETITAYVMEEVAGAGYENEDGLAVSRAKSGKKATAETHEILVVYEQGPSFPGGEDSLNSFLDQNIKYPLAFDGSGDTCVIAQFTVNKKGKIKDISILQSAGEEYDSEVKRVIALMPDWIPGVRENKNVVDSVTFSVHILTN